MSSSNTDTCPLGNPNCPCGGSCSCTKQCKCGTGEQLSFFTDGVGEIAPQEETKGMTKTCNNSSCTCGTSCNCGPVCKCASTK